MGKEELVVLVFDLTGHGKGFGILKRSIIVGVEGRVSQLRSDWNSKKVL